MQSNDDQYQATWPQAQSLIKVIQLIEIKLFDDRLLVALIQPGVNRLIHNGIDRRILDPGNRLQEAIGLLGNVNPNLRLSRLRHSSDNG